MKRRILLSGRFKKDLKKFRNDPKRRRKIAEVIDMLANNTDIPQVMRPHKLIGDYVGCMELHIEGDLLLIWIDEVDITLVRIGSHAEVF